MMGSYRRAQELRVITEGDKGVCWGWGVIDRFLQANVSANFTPPVFSAPTTTACIELSAIKIPESNFFGVPSIVLGFLRSVTAQRFQPRLHLFYEYASHVHGIVHLHQ